MKNRPLLPPALCFAAGILVEHRMHLGPTGWLLAAVVALAVAMPPTRGAVWALWSGWILAGGMAHAIQ